METGVTLISTCIGDFAAGAAYAQGYRSVSLAVEQGRLNEEWSANRPESTRILSQKAIQTISQGIEESMYLDRVDATQPVLMAPSTDPMMYSKVGLIHICVG